MISPNVIDVCVCVDALSKSLNAITISTEMTEEELKPHLDTVLTSLLEQSECWRACDGWTVLCISHKQNMSSDVWVLVVQGRMLLCRLARVGSSPAWPGSWTPPASYTARWLWWWQRRPEKVGQRDQKTEQWGDRRTEGHPNRVKEGQRDRVDI